MGMGMIGLDWAFVRLSAAEVCRYDVQLTLF